MALIYTALITPAEVALLEPARTASEALFIINRCERVPPMNGSL